MVSLRPGPPRFLCGRGRALRLGPTSTPTRCMEWFGGQPPCRHAPGCPLPAGAGACRCCQQTETLAHPAQPLSVRGPALSDGEPLGHATAVSHLPSCPLAPTPMPIHPTRGAAAPAAACRAGIPLQRLPHPRLRAAAHGALRRRRAGAAGAARRGRRHLHLPAGLWPLRWVALLAVSSDLGAASSPAFKLSRLPKPPGVTLAHCWAVGGHGGPF